MKVYDSYSLYNQKQIKTITSISVDSSNHFNLSEKQSNRFNETKNIENTVYCSWGGVTLHYSPIHPPLMSFQKLSYFNRNNSNRG